MTHVLLHREPYFHAVTGAHHVDGAEPECRRIPRIRSVDGDATQFPGAFVATHGVDAQTVFAQLTFCKQFSCSLKTTRSPEPGSLNRGFEKPGSGHPLRVEGESRPKGAEHCRSSYIVIKGTAERIDDSARVTWLLTKVAKGNADRIRIMQTCVTQEVATSCVDPIHDALVQRVERSGIIETGRVRAQTDDAERRRCEHFEVRL